MRNLLVSLIQAIFEVAVRNARVLGALLVISAALISAHSVAQQNHTILERIAKDLRKNNERLWHVPQQPARDDTSAVGFGCPSSGFSGRLSV